MNLLTPRTLDGDVLDPRTGRPELERLRAYYDQTWPDYRFFWMNPDNRAMHYGYWDDYTRTHAQSLIRMNQVLADRVGLRCGVRVLDAGCGVGGTAMWLAAAYDSAVVGITLVPSQVERARRYAMERHLEGRVQIELGDYRRTPFPDSSFDVFWAQETVANEPHKRDCLWEAFRVLKPGGRLVVSDVFRFARPYASADEHLMHAWLADWALSDLSTREEFVLWTGEAGFREIRLEDIQAHVFRSHRRLYRMAVLMYPLGVLLHGLGLRTDTQHKNLRGARDQYRTLRRGLWFEGILTAQKPD